MSKVNSQVTTFAEVFSTTEMPSHPQTRQATFDNRLMVYFQGMKIYIPDHFNPETVLKLLQVIRKL